MPKPTDGQESPVRRRAPATTIKKREDQMIALALGLAEKRLEDGTASSQIVCHFLELGSTKAALEREKIENENLLLRAKANDLTSRKETEELYKNALAAMRSYSGNGGQSSDDDE